jgi:hypothetical protein
MRGYRRVLRRRNVTGQQRHKRDSGGTCSMATARCSAISEFFTAASSSTISSSNFEISSAVSFAYLWNKTKFKPHNDTDPNNCHISANALVVAHEQDVVRLHGVARVERQRVLAESTQALQYRQIGAELAGVRCNPGIPGHNVTQDTTRSTVLLTPWRH